MSEKCPKCKAKMVVMGPYEAFEGYPHREDHQIDGLDCLRRQNIALRADCAAMRKD